MPQLPSRSQQSQAIAHAVLSAASLAAIVFLHSIGAFMHRNQNSKPLTLPISNAEIEDRILRLFNALTDEGRQRVLLQMATLLQLEYESC
jgi:uncharacterized membrane protein